MPPRYPIADAPYVLIDLDDTLAEFDGYQGWQHIGPPRPFAQSFVRKFKEHQWKTILWSTRAEVGLMKLWLEEHDFFDSEVGEGLHGDTDGHLLFDYIGQSPLNAVYGSNPAKPLADLIDQLFSLGYRLYWHTLPMFNPNNYFGSSENVFGDMASFNMVGIHRSLSQTIEGLVEISSPNDTWQPG